MDTVLRCAFCQKSFARMVTLENHLVLEHGTCDGFENGHNLKSIEAKPFNCGYCDKRFRKISSRSSHIRRLHLEGKAFECVFCERNFASRQELYSHLMYKHTKEKPYSCKVCGREFTMMGHLRRHKITHRKRDQRLNRRSSYPAQFRNLKTKEADQFQCDICDEEFTKQRQLDKHKKVHAGEVLYRCIYCLKEYACRDGLIGHIPSHIGEKPFNCNCGYCDTNSIQESIITELCETAI